MTQDEIELDLFRLRIRLNIVQEMALRGALLATYRTGNLDEAENLQALKHSISSNSQTADRQYGAVLRDPGKTAMYSDEVLAITEDMNHMLDLIAFQISGGKIGKLS